MEQTVGFGGLEWDSGFPWTVLPVPWYSRIGWTVGFGGLEWDSGFPRTILPVPWYSGIGQGAHPT